MKAIQATPKEIRKIFSDSYVIPDFQRPYSWEKEHCEILWDDIVGFHMSEPTDEERYFLGNIVVHPTEGGKLSVVDGQQRLTTLLLLIKAFFKSAGTYTALEKCLRILDKRNDVLTGELRVQSEVLADDAETLRKIVFDIDGVPDNSKLTVNFRYFTESINEWRKSTADSADALLNLIDTFLDRIVLLPIECGSDDDALTIFQTINNRGMSLTDADIFKAKLYHCMPESERGQFIENWKELGAPQNAERLFRVLMHIIRANNDITDKETGLRGFFTANKAIYLNDWQDVIASLLKINAMDKKWNNTDSNPEKYASIDALWGILKTYPNLYWNYPIYVYLHKYGKLTVDGEFELANEYLDELEQLFIETVRYYFLKGTVHNTVNTIKDTTFKVCAAIAAGEDYKTYFESNITDSDKTAMAAIFENWNISRNYLRGLVVLASYLNKKQEKKSFAEMLWTKYDIEHILPKEWNHYDGWTQETHEAHLNLLGNLMPLERAKNIKAQNEYLRKKQEIYKLSPVQDAVDICKLPDNAWTPQAVQKNHMEKISRLQTFFALP